MTFGVLFSGIDHFPQRELWRGIIDFAAKRDIHLIGYVGAYQSGDADLSLHLNTCFDAICNSKFLDGVILFSGYASLLVGDSEFKTLAQRIPKHIPCVSVSQIISGMPCILADNVDGAYAVIDHLIKVHKKTKIAFIKGPEGHRETDERLRGYQRALADNGLICNPAYILPGDLDPTGMQQTVAELLDHRNLPFDALVCNDDLSAKQAICELKTRGIGVPDEVSVTGFGDDCQTANLHLTTTRQDFFAMGKESAAALFSIVNGQPVPPITYVPSIFLARKSCGCLKRDFTDVADVFVADGTTLSDFLNERLAPLFPPEISTKRRSKWLATLTNLITRRPFEKKWFLQSVEEMLLAFGRQSKHFGVWFNVFNLCAQAIRLFPNEVDNAVYILETLMHATTQLNDLAASATMAQENIQQQNLITLRRVTGKLMLHFDIDTLSDEMCRLIPEVSIKTVLMGLYGTSIKSNDPIADRGIKTLVGFDGNVRFNIKNDEMRFSDLTTINDFNFHTQQRTLLFMPLFFKEEELGAVMVPYDPQIAMYAYDTLRLNLSTAVKGAELINKVKMLSVTDELTGLYNRRGLLQFVKARLDFMHRNKDMIIPLVMFIDVDGLKQINDGYGHSEGDRALIAFSELLKDNVRKDDIVSRIHGDEFVVFASVKDKDAALLLVTRLRDKVNHYNAQGLHPYQINCSIGQVVLEEATEECFSSAMLRADNALYDEKKQKLALGLARG